MKRILVTPLNWGLGHATRSIPLIRALESAGWEPVLASDGAALQLLRVEFPHLPCFELPTYGIRYAGNNMIRNMAWQSPRILYAIRAEHAAVKQLVTKHQIKGILSDNRYGCFDARISSVLLTHQLKMRVPVPALQWTVNGLLRLAFAKFDGIWVPDAPGTPNLTGALSHGTFRHPNIRYTGILSRMNVYPRDEDYDVAVILSGPEPQRSILEEKLLGEAMLMPQKFIFIQGKPKTRKHHFVADNIEVVSYLSSKELNDVMLSSHAIVCRSGYSSIMDLAALGKKALLIPTPGQTEQEYLGEQLRMQGCFVTQPQDKIRLQEGLDALQHTTGLDASAYHWGGYESVLKEWLEGLDAQPTAG
ncbi:MAG: glycosyltransferase [Lewinellaceae bacterium]|nr:glycosyltransferase [Lewinellaceae bacterium]